MAATLCVTWAQIFCNVSIELGDGRKCSSKLVCGMCAGLGLESGSPLPRIIFSFSPAPVTTTQSSCHHLATILLSPPSAAELE